MSERICANCKKGETSGHWGNGACVENTKFEPSISNCEEKCQECGELETSDKHKYRNLRSYCEFVKPTPQSAPEGPDEITAETAQHNVALIWRKRGFEEGQQTLRAELEAVKAQAKTNGECVFLLFEERDKLKADLAKQRERWEEIKKQMKLTLSISTDENRNFSLKLYLELMERLEKS